MNFNKYLLINYSPVTFHADYILQILSELCQQHLGKCDTLLDLVKKDKIMTAILVYCGICYEYKVPITNHPYFQSVAKVKTFVQERITELRTGTVTKQHLLKVLKKCDDIVLIVSALSPDQSLSTSVSKSLIKDWLKDYNCAQKKLTNTLVCRFEKR